MKRLIQIALALAVIGGALIWYLSQPTSLKSEELTALKAHEPDIANGENIFWAGGCASCHAAPKAAGEAKKLLSGGLVLETPFGGFAVPNISPDSEQGIGDWTIDQFANAMKQGVSPDGRHYYPAFPYASYIRMTNSDVADLFGFMKTLPPSSEPSIASEIAFPFNVRRGLGLWKLLFLDPSPIVADEALAGDPVLIRGRYLVEGIGHCGECHTPRNLAGGMSRSEWLTGAPSPEGKGNIPGITNASDDLADWTQSDIAYALETGFTPEFDSLGSSMADVVTNYANVAASDREAVAAYLKSLSN